MRLECAATKNILYQQYEGKGKELTEFCVGHIFTGAEWGELTTQVSLSTRQAQIATHLLEGLGDKQIALQLGISVHTVRTYLERIFAKLNVQDRNELVVSIFRQYRAGCDLAACPRSH